MARGQDGHEGIKYRRNKSPGRKFGACGRGEVEHFSVQQPQCDIICFHQRYPGAACCGVINA
jgi:hypothetical protein